MTDVTFMRTGAALINEDASEENLPSGDFHSESKVQLCEHRPIPIGIYEWATFVAEANCYATPPHLPSKYSNQ